jgi:hypothetical protein
MSMASDGWGWPDWVPLDLRVSIESFWSWHGGHVAWLRNQEIPHNNAHPLGTHIRAWCIGSDSIVIGRYVYAWNNIGRVVDDSGKVHCVSGEASDESVRAFIAARKASLDEVEKTAVKLREKIEEAEAWLSLVS